MSFVWLIEEPQLSGGMALTLAANVPVRVFASVKTACRMLSSAQLPDLIVVNEDQLRDVRMVRQLLQHERGVAVYQLDATHWTDDEKYLAVSQIRRMAADQTKLPKHLRYKDVQLDTLRFLIQKGDEWEGLSKKEMMILKVLMENAGQVISRRQIQDEVWRGLRVTERTLDSHVSRLRRRLEGTTVQIESRYGGGYTLL